MLGSQKQKGVTVSSSILFSSCETMITVKYWSLVESFGMAITADPCGC